MKYCREAFEGRNSAEKRAPSRSSPAGTFARTRTPCSPFLLNPSHPVVRVSNLQDKLNGFRETCSFPLPPLIGFDVGLAVAALSSDRHDPLDFDLSQPLRKHPKLLYFYLKAGESLLQQGTACRGVLLLLLVPDRRPPIRALVGGEPVCSGRVCDRYDTQTRSDQIRCVKLGLGQG